MKAKKLLYSLQLIGLLILVLSCKKENNDIKFGTYTDLRDGNVYKTVTIGKQVWMAENLRYLPDVAGPDIGSQSAPYYYVYGYDGTDLANAKATANYSTYGVLYNWEAAKSACPEGWHLPSDAEWTQLTDYLGGQTDAQTKIKEKGSTHWKRSDYGTNETGFTALPGGCRYYGGTFDFLGDYCYLWSSTEHNTSYVWIRYFGYGGRSVNNVVDRKDRGSSVRCVKD